MKPAIKNPVLDEGSLSAGKMFIVETANSRIERAKLISNPKELVGNLWKEGELLVLFAYTGSGKTIFALQIAKALSEGKSIFHDNINDCSLHNEAGKKKVLYFDAELSDKQFENRFSDDYKKHTEFDDNFFMMQINRKYILNEKECFSEGIIPEIESRVLKENFNVIIIDNLHCLKTGLEASKEAKPLMDSLTSLKHKHNVSIMIVGHTPKQHQFKEMNLSDLQGSSALSIQLDSCVAIGNSVLGDDIKYMVEVKRRDGKYIHNRNNVITCKIEKSNSFLKFVYQSLDQENSHLKNLNEESKEEIMDEIRQMKKEKKSLREMENYVPYGKSTIARMIEGDNVSKL